MSKIDQMKLLAKARKLQKELQKEIITIENRRRCCKSAH